ncbi:MAG: 3-phosphoserine/phosphohydroxythreonine aminotransferase [Gammaproteobacteria bacterium]|nr:3-phosphoserine/phosphohydroxythreonine aminotransferase [Gammaproteobacteria bacterium]
MTRVFNFGAGPAMLPTSVMQKAQQEFLNYAGMGASVIEISHRSKEFEAIINEADELLSELANIPSNYKILYVHGGAQMQFSAIPLNLLNRKQERKAAYVESGNFAKLANKEAARFGDIDIIASSEETNYDRIPTIDPKLIEDEYSYLHITSNNTIYGTRFQQFPMSNKVPLVADMTSEFLSRKLDIGNFGVIFAGLQKNLGPSGLALVIIREDLLEFAMPNTPNLLHYKTYSEKHSLANTNNTFAIYMMKLVLEWLSEQGGVAAVEEKNEAKANLIYDVIDQSNFYLATAQPEHRSIMNITFNLADNNLLDEFLNQALEKGLYALKGHRNVGGVRASIYNAMPEEGCKALAAFMHDFERKSG